MADTDEYRQLFQLLEKTKSDLADRDKILVEQKHQIEDLNVQLKNQTELLKCQSQQLIELTGQLKLLNKNIGGNITTLTAPKSKRKLNVVNGHAVGLNAKRAASSSTSLENWLISSEGSNSNLEMDFEQTNQGEIDNQSTVSTNITDKITNASNATISSGESWSNVTSGATSNPTGKSASNQSSGAIRVTPIQLGSADRDTYTKIIGDLHAKFNGVGYRWLQLKSFSTPRIFADSIDIKNEIMSFLTNAKIEFNTFAEKTLKRKAFLVRGMALTIDELNIKLIGDALADVGVTGTANITRFNTGHMKREPNPNRLPLYQVVLEPTADTSAIHNIKTIGGFCVRFEVMKPAAVIQCRRCQRYSHTANNCNFNYRCVQCISEHGPGQCPRLENSNLPLGCVNCSAAKLQFTGHTANDYFRCQFYKKANGTASTNGLNGNANNSKSQSNNDATTTASGTKSKPTPDIRRFNNINEATIANGPQNRIINKTAVLPGTGTSKAFKQNHVTDSSGKKRGKSGGKRSEDSTKRLISALMQFLSSYSQ